MGMKRKLVLIVVCLVLVISVGVVYAQEAGYFLDITNSNANIQSAITNSTVIENVTLTNGTLNLQINADNISTVTINGINYTAQPAPAPGTIAVTITYYGENTVPAGLTGWPTDPYNWVEKSTNQTISNYVFYTWKLTMLNINSMDSPFPAFDRTLPSLVSKYPELLTRNATEPNTINLTNVDLTGAL